MARKNGELTPKQARFVEEFLVDLNATQAAIRAGYSEKTAGVIGHENLTKPEIASAVEKGKKAASSKTGLQRERILREVELMAHSCITDYVFNEDDGSITLAEGAPPDAMRAIKSVKKKRKEWSDGSGEGHTVQWECELSFWDKPGMVKLAGRHKAVEGFSDRVEVTDKDGKDLIPSLVDAVAALMSAVPPKRKG